MTLDQYLDKHRMTLTEFAERIGVNVSTVHRYATGTRIPTREIMQRIKDVTSGKVRADDFYAAADPP